MRRGAWFHTELTEYTEFCSACFCESLRRLRETIPLRTALVKIRAHSWLKKKYE